MTDRHTIDTTVGPLAVRVVGDGSTAVLWPSLFMNGRSWDRVLPALAQDRRLLVLDGPGHGASGDPGRRYSLRECATAAGQVLDRLAVTDPGGLGGQRLGRPRGPAVRRRPPVAVPEPGHARNTGGGPVPPNDSGRIPSGRPRVLGPNELVLTGVTEVLLSGHSRVNDPEAVDLVRDSLRRAIRRMLRNAVRSIPLGREDLTSLLPQVTAPKLLVTGSDHSGFTPAQAEAAGRLIPTGELPSWPMPPTPCRSRRAHGNHDAHP
jgi:pimeloyl-ACP methyl ester carboxylesterase